MELPKHNIKIDNMTVKTVEAVSQVEQESFATPWSFDSLVEELSNPLAVFRTAEVDGDIVGYVGMHHIIDEGYITNIAVMPNFRGNGIARALMNDLLEYGRANKLRMITLEVRESNKAAQKLYSSLDFKIEGKRKNFYTLPTENAIIMTKEL